MKRLVENLNICSFDSKKLHVLNHWNILNVDVGNVKCILVKSLVILTSSHILNFHQTLSSTCCRKSSRRNVTSFASSNHVRLFTKSVKYKCIICKDIKNVTILLRLIIFLRSDYYERTSVTTSSTFQSLTDAWNAEITPFLMFRDQVSSSAPKHDIYLTVEIMKKNMSK